MEPMTIAVVQMNSVLDAETNLIKLSAMIEEGKQKGADTFFLPECFLSMSNGTERTPFLVTNPGEWYRRIQNLAKDHHVNLIGGSAAAVETPEDVLNPNAKILNRAYNFDKQGVDLGHYDKIHLFACDLPEKKIFESKTYTSGNELKMISVPDNNSQSLKIGMNICFDLRFSEQALALRKQGAQILTYGSAFTVPTGEMHWHVLLRARAIESQCFVVAAAQWGFHNEKIQTYGHSLVVDPWGKVLMDLGNGEKVGVVKISINEISLARQSILMSRGDL